ncbi:synaptonemal complex central element protein 2-like [Branchiostoma floridae]|uniref:Synaptonemal complex central element protein 2-like n=1 Tax=Branchiostoma floridae TaxID=7739 RepID=A0A9J7MEN7_BRAFL|nr:synaptonemal complex central element protein 2-like [Branchiostoma floridae]
METRSTSAKAGIVPASQQESRNATKDDKMFKHPGETAATRETAVQEAPTSDTDSVSYSEPAIPVSTSEPLTESPMASTVESGMPTREMLNQSAQKLVDDINSKRKRDAALLSDFKKALEIQVGNSCSLLESSMYQTYERTGARMQEKLQELFAVLDRVSKLEAELKQFRQALGMLYTDVQAPQTQ